MLSAVALKSALDDLNSKFEAATGHKLLVSYGTAGELAKRIQGGETVDVTILPKPWMDQLVQQDKVLPDSVVKFASASVGVAVPAGAPKPDITSPDALKRSLLVSHQVDLLRRSGKRRSQRNSLCACVGASRDCRRDETED